MSLPVHLVDSLDGAGPGSDVVVDGDEGHHAVVVRRLRVGERVVLTDGAGVRAECEVTRTDKRSFAARVDTFETLPEPRPRVTVVQALPKGERGELAVEVLTEIGVAVVVPWAADRSVAVWRGERAEKSLAKWRATAREAAKQARRAWHPEVRPLATTDDVVGLVAAVVADGGLALVLHEDATEPLPDLASAAPDAAGLLVVVGPEGGLTDAEVAAFVAAGATSVRLGAEVLRTSTAGLAAVAALLARTPRWGA